MPRKTNKTSHVLNLLTNGNAQDSDGTPETSPPSPEPNSAVNDSSQAASQKITVVNEASQNDKIANEILSNLEGQLLEEIGEADVENEPAEDKTEKAGEPGKSDAASEALPAASLKTGEKEKISARDLAGKEAEEVGGVAMSEVLSEENEAVVEGGEEIVSVKDVSVPAAAETGKEEAKTAGEAAPVQEEEPEEEHGYRTVNVMEQILKRQKLEMQMSQYEVCQCSRCRADVAALILTRMPAKYVVTDEDRVAPIVSFYESKFKVRILTEIIKSCIDVKENPRHSRKTPLLKPLQ